MSEAERPESNDISDRYDYDPVSDRVGQGGFASVFKARQRATGQVVAVKRMLLAGDPDLRAEQHARFEREMKLIAGLTSPFVVRLLDYGYAGGHPCMILEYVHGRQLNEVVAEKPMDAQVAVRVISQVLEGLAEAHAKGIVHRDLKPANIMLTGEAARPTAKVLDFGIAGVEESFGGDVEKITQFGQIRGTPSYMPPEQFTYFSTPRPESDIYAVGLILLECLTGKPAVKSRVVRDPSWSDADFHLRSATDIYQQQCTVPVPVPLDVAGTALGDVIAKACAKAPDDRYPSASKMLDALERSRLSPMIAMDTAPVPREVVQPVNLAPRASTKKSEARDRLDIHEVETLYTTGDVRASAEADASAAEGSEPAGVRGLVTLVWVLAALVLVAALVGVWWFGVGRPGADDGAAGAAVTAEAAATSAAGEGAASAESDALAPVVQGADAVPQPGPTPADGEEEAAAGAEAGEEALPLADAAARVQAQALLQEGMEALVIGDWLVARDAFGALMDSALDDEETLGQALLGLARAQRELGDLAAALKTYDRYLELFPAGRLAKEAQTQRDAVAATLAKAKKPPPEKVAPSCAANQRECRGRCVDVQVDAANCGGCGKRCDAKEQCVGGVCKARGFRPLD